MSILSTGTPMYDAGPHRQTGAFHTRPIASTPYGQGLFRRRWSNPNKPVRPSRARPLKKNSGPLLEAKKQTGATVSVIYVPPPFAPRIDEAVDRRST